MARWDYKVKIKHLFTEAEDHQSIQKSMNEIADVLQRDPFISWNFRPLKKFRSIPKGDETFGPVDYANRLLEKLYDFADSERIWIG